MNLEITQPAWLWLLVALPLLWWYFKRSLVDFSLAQRIVSLVVRGAVFALLALALANLTLLEPTQQRFFIFAVDASKSVGDEAKGVADRFVEEARAAAGDDRTAVLRFGKAPGTVRSDDGNTAPNLDADGTDIASALEVAAAAIPPFYVPHIVLISDGNETHGDAVATAMGLDSIPVSTVPLPARLDPEVQVSSVTAPAQVREGEPFNVDVVIDSNHDDEGLVEVFRGAHKILSEKRKLKPGENRLVFQQSVTGERTAKFTVRISGCKDTLLDNNTESGIVFAEGKPRVLLIESEPRRARHLQWALKEEDIIVDVRPPQGLPDSLTDLQNYELVALSNVPATALRTRQMEMLRTYVQDLGGGFLMIGGDQSFGLGGYYKTVIEEILPVRSDFEKEKEKPSLAMVLVIDKSGSMGGMKIELAKDAAKSAVELLGRRDRIGVVAFDGSPYWVSEVQTLASRATVMDSINGIQAGGGTAMYPAMEAAYTALEGISAKLKHVIILTDGRSSPGDFVGITQSMSAGRMTVSTVALGQGADRQLLEQIANEGGGRHYFTDDPSSVPQIFAKETMTASRSAVKEQPFLPIVTRPTQAMQAVDLESAPFLLGYVVTRPKPTAEIILATESGDPLLAWWRYGLGMAVAFTSDAKNRWAAEWVSWPQFSRFWAQVIRHCMRKGEARGVRVTVDRKGDRATIKVDAITPNGRYLNDAVAELTVIGPDLERTQLTMVQTAPGRYEATFDTKAPGAYHLETKQGRDGKVLQRQSRGLIVGYPDELRLRPVDRKLLQDVASVSGGHFDPQTGDLFGSSGREVDRATPLWPWLLTAALCLFVVDVGLRRLDLFPGGRRTR